VIFCFIILGASQYSYIFIRSLQDAPYLGSNIRSFKDFWWFISLTGHRTKIFGVPLRELVTFRIPLFAVLLKDQFRVSGIVVALIGLYRSVRDHRKYAIFFLLIMAGILSLSLSYGGNETYAYLIPVYLVFTILISIGMKRLISMLKFLRSDNLPLKLVSRKLLLIFFGLYGLFLCITNYPIVNQSENTFYDEFTNTVIENVERDSVILSPHYEWTEYYLYKLLGEERRRGDNIWVVHHWNPQILRSYLLGEETFPANPLPYPPKNIKNIYFQSREGEVREAGLLCREIAFDHVKLCKAVLKEAESFMLSPDFPTDVIFGDQVQLLGYNLSKAGIGFKATNVYEGTRFYITYYWRCLAEMGENYRIFVHIVDKDGVIVAQNDHDPVHGRYPTSRWKKGEIIRETYDFFVPLKVPKGTYTIRVGLSVPGQEPLRVMSSSYPIDWDGHRAVIGYLEIE